MRLDLDDLHAGLQDEVLGSVSFLNEVMRRYPDAISFAPGAPHPSFYNDLDISKYIDIFLEYQASRGRAPDAALRALYEYGPSGGLINDLVAEALARDLGVPASPEAITITVGAQEAMLLALRALCRSERDLLAVVEPCYVGLVGAARLLGIPVVAVPEGDHGVDCDRLEARCRSARSAGRRVKALYIAPDHANPSGTVTDQATRIRLLELAERHDLILLEDTAYGFTTAPERGITPLKALDTAGRVVCIGTFAKVCLPGARVGYVLADQTVRAPDGSTRTLARELARLKNMVTVNTSPICQALVGGMLVEAGGSLAELARRKSALYQRNLDLLLDALDRRLPPDARGSEIGWNRPAGGFFVRVRVPVPADEALLERCATLHGVLWTPMSHFYLGPGGERELRLSCSYLDPAQIEEGVARLAAFLADLGPTDPGPRHRDPRTVPYGASSRSVS